MSSKYQEAFDSLSADEDTKRKRTEQILSLQSADVDQIITQGGAASAAKARNPVFAGKRGVAIILAIVIFFVVAISIPVGVFISNNRGLLGAMSLLKNTFVDMDGVAAFGVWNAPKEGSSSPTARISNVAYIHKTSSPAKSEITLTEENDGPLTGDWSDDERYDWESDYDWDPTKANVLIAIDEDGKISEVVYERTNGRGQVRQDKLGNAAAVYVSNGFTYVMYVDDDEWEFWKEINFAQEMYTFTGFHCHHERMQTVVIHNATGKVFALKDLIPQVNELSGATNYTMQVQPFQDDFLYVRPLYGNSIPQWYNIVYDEQTEKIRYELVLPADKVRSILASYNYNVRAVRRDRYGQQYLLAGNSSPERVGAGIVNLPQYSRYGNALLFTDTNGMMLGTDGRMYVFDGDKLKVFGENFELHTVEPDTEVAFEGIADDFHPRRGFGNDGIVYKLKNGYLYSMFGEVWKVNDDGTMLFYEQLQGSFPRFADDGYLMGGEIIAFVDTQLKYYDGLEYAYSVNGRMVQLDFESTGFTHRAVVMKIIDASEITVYNRRMVVEQNENPYSPSRGKTQYFLITVQNGKPNVEYFAYGRDGGVLGLTNPITQPLTLS